MDGGSGESIQEDGKGANVVQCICINIPGETFKFRTANNFF